MALSQLSVAQRGCITEGYASGLIHCGYGNVRGRQSSSLGRCVMHCGLAGWLAGWLAGNCPLVGLPRINRDVDESSGGQMVAGPGIPHSALPSSLRTPLLTCPRLTHSTAVPLFE